MAKLRVVIDVEDRIKDEIKELLDLRNSFMKTLSSVAEEKRGVLYSELLFDEAFQLLVKMTEDFSSQLQVNKVQDTIRSIYRYRTEAQTKDRFMPLLSRLELHSQVVGNLLGTSTYHRDLLLETFYGKALPPVLRKEVWKALMRNPQTEQKYLQDLMTDRWKTISRNEIEIVRRAQELLSEHCPSLAYNHEAIMGMKTTLSYFENLISHRLPEFLYYMVLPIFHTFSDSYKLPEQIISISLRFGEIQSTVFAFEGPMWRKFMDCLNNISKSLYEKFRTLLNLSLVPNQERLDEFVQPIIARLTSGFVSIDVTCLVYDQLVMRNCTDYLFYVLCVMLILIQESIHRVKTWDNFLEVFYTLSKRITVPELESVLPLIPETPSFEELEAVPLHFKGRDYLNYQLAMQEEANKRVSPTDVLLSEDPRAGLMTRMMSKGNLMENMLGRINTDKKLVLNQTLLKANLDQLDVSKGSSNALNVIPPERIFNRDFPSEIRLHTDQSYPQVRISPEKDKSRSTSNKHSLSKQSAGDSFNMPEPQKAKLMMRQGPIPFIDLDNPRVDILEGFSY
mmetsp:Transcript_18235/g.32680  ORF Transcript_18235/g.32680 Transcript_18235/m.32680 type:complete len:564 (+) Transcript_18235:952-2643(+)